MVLEGGGEGIYILYLENKYYNAEVVKNANLLKQVL